MQTQLADSLITLPAAREAAQIIGRCVHCGFCTATCPTYQLLGDELDGPRGRIYLIKQVLEGEQPTAKTQLHLDRCLSCRSCETTCPSGVQYGRLLDIGRGLVEQRARGRTVGAQAVRWVLREGLTSAAFGPALRLGQLARPLLPAALKAKVPPRQDAGRWPARAHARRMVLLAGCVQPAMLPNVNAATARVFDALGVELIVPRAAGCCGALRYHLDDHDGGLADARRNIDAWWPHVQAGAEAIVMNASGCGAMVKDYGHLLRDDPAYAHRAERIAALTRDAAEVLPAELARLVEALPPKSAGAPPQKVVFHPPCTLQHGQRVRGAVESLLAALGAEVLPFADGHLCCGSAGTYSVLQPDLATRLRDRKLQALQAPQPEVILSANVGCIAHLASGTNTPVRHWIEWLDARLRAAGDA
jgi:glycolate oxidase iron-sulfur subunit